MKQIIEASTSRGTWQASEMRGIGELYERLVGFLDSVAPQPASTQEPEPAHTQGESND